MSDAAAVPATGPDVPWPQMTGQAVSDLIGFSPRWLSKLAEQGYLERKENGLFDLGDVLIGYIRFLKDADRRTAKSAPGRELIDAQVQKLKIENDKRIEALIETDLAEQFSSESMSATRSVFLNLQPLPDADLESRFKGRMATAIEAAERKSTDFFTGIRACRPASFVDDEA